MDKEIKLFTLKNAAGMVAKVTSYGAILTELHVPDRAGKSIDVVLGFDTVDAYFGDHPHFGGTIGRVANRIAGARFTLDGKEYGLAKNNGEHSIHGGEKCFDRVTWDATSGEDAVTMGPQAAPNPGPAEPGRDGSWVRFTRTSPDGEEGFPGTVVASVMYRVTPKNELVIEMSATTDRPTLVNLAHHSYWNLGGHASGDVLDQEVQIFADYFTPTDATSVPLGTIDPVAGTPFDFTKPKKLGQDLFKMGRTPPGYDINYVVRGKLGELRPAARAFDPTSGVVMDLETNEPGIQLYTSNYLDGSLKGKGGAAYPRHGAFCLETQRYPDAVHHPEWPTPILRPGETYRHVMVHRFSVG